MCMGKMIMFTLQHQSTRKSDAPKIVRMSDLVRLPGFLRRRHKHAVSKRARLSVT